MALKFLNKLKMRYLTAVCLFCVFLAGCSVKKYDETKQNDVDFTVLSEEEIPEQVSEISKLPRQKISEKLTVIRIISILL